MPQQQIDQMKEHTGRTAVSMDGMPFPFTGYPMEQITTVIDIRDYAETKLNGIRCYASQLQPDMMPLLQGDFDPATNHWFWQEAFILAHPKNKPDADKEDDLFAGVR